MMQQSSLFAESHEPERPVKPTGPFAAIAIERSLDRVLDYLVPPALVNLLKVGQRVKVPLGRGNKPVPGYVIAINPTTATVARIKPITGIDDERVLLPPSVMELARWMSRYYCCALGTVLESVIPAAVKKKVGLDYTPTVRLNWPRERIQEMLEKTKPAKRRAILARLLQLGDGESADLNRVAEAAGATPATVRKLAKVGVISITLEPDYQVSAETESQVRLNGEAGEHVLNEDQQRVYDEVRGRLGGGFSVNLLHGVTGSGKTEVYLRCIKDVIAAGRRAIVLVPEIALTPQTVARFTRRFPRVAILHSGLAASVRHRYWQQIAQGHADVVVGARSAIFAPIPNLGIIVIDEEHESSYKQDSAPRYHGRDVAIKRGQIEKIPVLLGSATPSLESWHRAMGGGAAGEKSGLKPALRTEEGRHGLEAHDTNAREDTGGPPVPLTQDGGATSAIENPKSKIENPYHLLSLPRRVRGLQLPEVELIDMKLEAQMHRPGVHLLSRRLEQVLKTTIEEKHQAILLLNRRGYSNFVYCSSCREPVRCKYCDVTMTYHRSAGVKPMTAKFEEGRHTGQLHCHYCLAVIPLPAHCPTCNHKLSLFGLGTQRVEEELQKKFPDLKYARVDSDTMTTARDYEAVLGAFARGEIQVMLGTQMIAKGLDYPNVTLVGVISGDTALSLPDFRASERTFQLITQVAGRAGRGDFPGRVILQTFQPDDATIRAALGQDYAGFATSELRNRHEVGLPPVTRMVRIVLRDEDAERALQQAEKLAAAMNATLAADPALQSQVTLKGPMPCAINRIAGHHRMQILLFSPSALAIQRALAVIRHAGKFAETDRVGVDVDPVSLL